MKWFYKLSAKYPRLLPKTESEYLEMKRILLEHFGVKDEPATWATVAGQIQGTPINKMRKSYHAIANAAKRGDINGLAETHKRQAFADNNQRIKEALESLAKKDEGNGQSIPEVQEGSFEVNTDLPILHTDKKGLVPLP